MSKHKERTDNKSSTISVRTTKHKKQEIQRKALKQNTTVSDMINDFLDQTDATCTLKKKISALIKNQQNIKMLQSQIERNASKDELLSTLMKIQETEATIWRP